MLIKPKRLKFTILQVKASFPKKVSNHLIPSISHFLCDLSLSCSCQVAVIEHKPWEMPPCPTEKESLDREPARAAVTGEGGRGRGLGQTLLHWHCKLLRGPRTSAALLALPKARNQGAVACRQCSTETKGDHVCAARWLRPDLLQGSSDY